MSTASSVFNPHTEDLIISDRVWVNGTKPGFIQYIGETHFGSGEWAGVVLDDPTGKNDGSVGGVRYFQCEPKRGVFVRLHRLTRSPISAEAARKASSSPNFRHMGGCDSAPISIGGHRKCLATSSGKSTPTSRPGSAPASRMGSSLGSGGVASPSRYTPSPTRFTPSPTRYTYSPTRAYRPLSGLSMGSGSSIGGDTGGSLSSGKKPCPLGHSGLRVRFSESTTSPTGGVERRIPISMPWRI